MKHWKQEDDQLLFRKQFDTFDTAWDFMRFLAKLCRSLDHYPLISNSGDWVQIRLEANSKKATEFRQNVDGFFTPKDNQSVVDKSTTTYSANLFCDGGSRGNPGPSASGFVIYNESEEKIAEGGEYLGITTNNQAEYHSLKDGVEKALELGVRELKVHMDSQLVVKQIKGEYKVKNRDLWPLYESAKELLEKLESYEIVHVPRELNKEADAMANKLMDEHTAEV